MSNLITSSKNPQIQHLRQLVSVSKYRQRHRQTVLDGVHLCDAYLRSGGSPVQVFVGVDSMKNPEVSELLFRLDESVDVVEVPESLYERVSSLEQGVAILFVIAMPEKALAAGLSKNSLLLESVQDPGNVGAILRTAAAAGVQDVYLSAGSAAAWSPKVLRAGMGAHFGLNIYEGADLAWLISSSKDVAVLATSLKAKRSIYEADLGDGVAWLFGNEGSGVSEELLNLCKENTVIIPQADGVESLNVAAAVAVCLFEGRRQSLSIDFLP